MRQDDGTKVVLATTELAAGGRLIEVTRAAAATYQLRVRPSLLNYTVAADELARLIALCGMLGPAPEWARCSSDMPQFGDTMADHFPTWVLCGDDIALPVRDGHQVIACLARGALSDKARERRQARRAKRSAGRKAIRQIGNGKVGDARHKRRPMHEFAKDEL